MPLRVLALAVLLTGCSGTIREIKQLPGEARVFAMDQNTLWEACRPSRADDGRWLTIKDDIAGCYDANIDTIFLEDSCRGAKAERHERAHRAGIKDPKAAGYNWSNL